ncbi:MAG TPA: sugar phosphate isomerase/epimerase [Bacteroidota bacterium]|nr:sugar phosphate isomerase/epimerase [Bacteroidota bacterium]
MKKNIELMNLFWTTAGIVPGEGEMSRFDFRDRVESAAHAGFKGIGIWHTDLEHILLHYSLNDMKSILADYGIDYLELEFLTDWFLTGGRKNESDNRKRKLLHAAEALHAKHIKVGDFYNETCAIPRLAESFASLCKEAEEHGTSVGFELMGCAVINNINDAVTMVKTAGAKNGGIILDIYQVANLGITYDEIRTLPPEHLISVELNDGTLPSNPNHDPSNRTFCGGGEYDLYGFIECIQAMGYAGPWAVEIISSSLSKLPLDEMNARTFSTTMASFRQQPVGILHDAE